MKNIILVLFIIVVVFINNCCLAVEIPKFELSNEISLISYKEPGVMKQSGIMSGIAGAYTYSDEIVFRFELRLLYGLVDYTSTSTGSMDSIDDILFEFRAITGWNLSPDEECIILPYFGYGYRYLEDNSQGRITTTDHLGYKREANYYYAPIGLSIIKQTNNGFTIQTNIEYDLFLIGIQKSYLSDAIPGRSDLANKQKIGYGYKASLSIEKQYSYLDISIEPYLMYWNIGQSESADITDSGIILGYGYEPKNYSTEYGLKVSLCF